MDKLTDERVRDLCSAIPRGLPVVYDVSAQTVEMLVEERAALAREVLALREAAVPRLAGEREGEIERLREFAERVIDLCEWGPSAWIGEDEENVFDAAMRLKVLVGVPHAQPCLTEGCECDGSRTLLQFAWRSPLPAPSGAKEEKDNG